LTPLLYHFQQISIQPQALEAFAFHALHGCDLHASFKGFCDDALSDQCATFVVPKASLLPIAPLLGTLVHCSGLGYLALVAFERLSSQ
jgi:hypothetical protein